MYWLKRTALAVVVLIAAAVLAGIGVIFAQARQKPDTHSHYVALGSSFAAGLGLGERAPGSPFACQRSVNGYPQQLARLTGVSLSDQTCSGATAHQVLHGGQFFQNPQIDAVGPDTELVTLTAGGNDIDYVGDLVMMAYQKRGGIFASLIDRLSERAEPAEERRVVPLQSELSSILGEVSRRAPRAHIVVITYPTILPPAGTCAQIGIGEAEAAMMRRVGARLADVTREAARTAGATLVDMASLSADHHACSADPWVNGATPEQGAPFHPNLAGAQAVARQILLILDKTP